MVFWRFPELCKCDKERKWVNAASFKMNDGR